MEIQGSNAHPSLNVIERQPTSATQIPILFVHGANMSAWCWDENFMSFFAKMGHPTYAVSLRGHGNSGGQHQLASNSIADYVTDIQRVLDEIGVTPILIGLPGDTKLHRAHASPSLCLTSSYPSTWITPLHSGSSTL
ncbi:MAG: alpha/beta fold hydrolase [Cycloclasticus sp.]|nr:alpha/beta fold hydrolase [Cycloclasticus sp.]